MNYWWRLFATGLCFQIFALGGVLLTFGVSIFFLLMPAKLLCRKKAMRFIIFSAFRKYVSLLKWLGLLTLEVEGLDRLKQSGQFIVANHPTLLDVVFIISMVRNADCIVREGLRNNPLTAVPIRAAGYVKNSPPRLLKRAVESLNEGNSLVVFPEGTRTKPDQPLSFLRGAANIALMSKKRITPIVITCKPATLLKHQKWYTIPKCPPHYLIRILPDIAVDQWVDTDMMQSRAARVLTRQLEAFFKVEMERSDSAK